MGDTSDLLIDMQPQKTFFIGIDSDGCVFDSMEIKQKECFCPQFINHMNLQSVSKYARETWEFVNLYSTFRGVNRFLALARTLDLLKKHPQVSARNITIPELHGLRNWIQKESHLNNSTLLQELEVTSDPDLKDVFAWSMDVNEAVKKIVRNVPPFPFVYESLKKIQNVADAVVISQTPYEALHREWCEHKLENMVRIIAGQEMGTKTEQISFAVGEKYAIDKCLMIGDVPGDFNAAKRNGILFYPINPGQEEQSWERFYKDAFGRFLDGTFAGTYQASLLEEFNRLLPGEPSWG
jgi:phosphoglycolate phosphatase-like HAD superfamily hydrolase